MRNVQMVLIVSDTDCDGTTFGAHRVAVPERFALGRDPVAVAEFAWSAQAPWAPRPDEVCEVMTLADFLSMYSREFRDQRHIEEFCGRPHRSVSWETGEPVEHESQFPYTSLRSIARWNPWVFDDTIGIPALDTRYDDVEAGW